MSEQEQQDQENKEPEAPQEPEVKVKRVRQIGVLHILLLFFLVLITFTVTPLYSIIYDALPENVKVIMAQDYYQKHVFIDTVKTIDQPDKYTVDTPLKVLGDNSGVCFRFPVTIEKPNPKFIDTKRLENAKRGKKIADVIVVGKTKYEYELNSITYAEDTTDPDNPHTTICQVLGREYGINPMVVNVIYMRPLREFTVSEMFWASTKDYYED